MHVACRHVWWHCVCMHVGTYVVPAWGHISVVCSMRDVRNVVHVKFDTDHPPTLNLCCIILIIKICSVHLIWCRTNTCFGYHYTYCRTHMPISGLQKSFSTWWKHEEPLRCVHGKGCCVSIQYPGLSSLAAEHPYSLSLETAKDMAV